MKSTLNNIISVISIWVILFIISLALSFNSIEYKDIPVVYIMTFGVVVYQIISYFHSLFFKTELIFDLIGSLSFISIVILGLIFTKNFDFNKALISFLLILWAGRLGIFLFIRRINSTKDNRLVHYFSSPSKLFVLWNMQAFWVVVSALPIITVLTSSTQGKFGLIEWAGSLIFIFGFALEIIADNQKRSFRKNTTKMHINTGLWAYSRHPNYLGEIILWTGLTIISINYLSGFTFISLLTPVFVFVLLRYISGVPQLEASAEKKWGRDKKYINYKKNVGLLFPKIL